MKSLLRQTIRLHQPLHRVEVSVSAPPSHQVADGHAAPGVVAPDPESLVDPPSIPQDVAAVRALLERVTNQCELLSHRWKRDRRAMQELAVELAVIVGEHLLNRSVDRANWALEPWVSQAVQQLGLEQPLRVLIHPKDKLELEKVAPPEDLETLFSRVSIESSSDVSPGDCVVLKGEEGLLLDHGARLESIRDVLLKGLDDARIERTSTETSS